MAQRSGMLELTGDAFKSSLLERMVSRTTNSYKLYWLQAILDEVLAGSSRASFARLSARMVAGAWHPVNYFRLSLGAQDQLGQAVAVCGERLSLRVDAEPREVVRAVEESRDPKVRKCVDDLCRYVPYRLIRAFYEEAGSLRGMPDAKVNAAVFEMNRGDPMGSLYVLDADAGGLEVQPEWAAYIRDNRLVVQGWLDMRLVEYLQARNPSVPAIPMKVHRPAARGSLAEARRYWRAATERAGLREIYTGAPFCPASFDELGPLSVDHFIPWSFVLHDEMWNLVPVFRDVNSSKGDRLPDLEDYLPAFCGQQFDALMATRETLSRRSAVLESYLQVDPDVCSYDDSAACRRRFSERLAGTVRPLHQIAQNQGFAVWRPRRGALPDVIAPSPPRFA